MIEETMVTARRRLGMTKATIVDAAVRLTREHGLDGWNQRQLTGALDTSPSVIFHHVGDRRALNAAVVERVLTPADTPGFGVDWEDWFRGAMRSIRPRLAEHPGVAHWMLMNGPVFDHLMPVLDEAMTTLLDAGFGDEAPLVYAVVFNTMISLMAFTDERAAPEQTDKRDHRQMVEAISAKAGDAPGPGARALLRLLGQYTDPSADREKINQIYFEYTLDRVLAGLRLRLEELTEAD